MKFISLIKTRVTRLLHRLYRSSLKIEELADLESDYIISIFDTFILEFDIMNYGTETPIIVSSRHDPRCPYFRVPWKFRIVGRAGMLNEEILIVMSKPRNENDLLLRKLVLESVRLKLRGWRRITVSEIK